MRKSQNSGTKTGIQIPLLPWINLRLLANHRFNIFMLKIAAPDSLSRYMSVRLNEKKEVN